jgi:glutamate racemase
LNDMQVDLAAGTRYQAQIQLHPSHSMSRVPKILVFDSGLGGLTVFTEVVRLRPDAQFVYCADDAGFPYGALSEAVLIARVGQVIEKVTGLFAPDAMVIACNTASTLVLPHLRQSYPQVPFIGTVPAVKPAAEQSRSGLISVLATPGTVARDYTKELIRTYANHCKVTLVGSTRLAGFAEAFMQGEALSDADIAAEIAPCFVTERGAKNETKTDHVVLACTHYPLLLAHFERLAPWPVEWIDPAPAIARRADHVLREELGYKAAFPPAPGAFHQALFTSGRSPTPALAEVLHARGLVAQASEPIVFT